MYISNVPDAGGQTRDSYAFTISSTPATETRVFKSSQPVALDATPQTIVPDDVGTPAVPYETRGEVADVLRRSHATKSALTAILGYLVEDLGTQVKFAVEVTDFKDNMLIVMVSGEPYATLAEKLEPFIEQRWASLTPEQQGHVGVWAEGV